MLFAVRAFVYSLLLAGGSVLFIARAAVLDPVTGGGEGPIVIDAENGLEWIRDDRRFIARGNATAVRGDTRVRGDTLFAFYSDHGDSGASAPSPGVAGSIHRLEAHGSVVITAPGRTARGEKAVYDALTGVFTLFGDGKPVSVTTFQDTVTARDMVRYDSRSLVATATGNARVSRQDRTMSGDTLVARMGPSRRGTVLETVDATGNVRIVTAREQGTGERGHYDARTGIATLTGSVTLTRDGNVLTGEKAVFDMNTGLSRLIGGSGRARALLVPEKPVQDGAKNGSDALSDPRPGPR